MTNKHVFRSPDNVYLIGAGRWARVILHILCKHLSRSTEIIIVSAQHAETMQKWIDMKIDRPRLRVVNKFPQITDPSGAVIVANAAKDHEAAARVALSHNLPVLVEKPLSLTANSTKTLIEIAQEKNIYLAAAHVFLFNEYLSHFAKTIEEAHTPSSIIFLWSDAKTEIRYGENKCYDNNLPIILDVFPHIFTILRTIMPHRLISFTDLALEHKGSALSLQLRVGDIPCTVRLARNETRRTRLLELMTMHGPLRLDFSKEPGTITNGTRSYSGDPLWATRLGPLVLQVRSFLEGAVHGNWDSRLTPFTAYEANLLMDKMMIYYHSAQHTLMNNQN